MDMPRFLITVFLGFLLSLSTGCAREVVFQAPVLTPASFDLAANGIKRLSIADFEGESQAGNIGMAERIRAELVRRATGVVLKEPGAADSSGASGAVLMGRVDASYDRKQVQDVVNVVSRTTTKVAVEDEESKERKERKEHKEHKEHKENEKNEKNEKSKTVRTVRTKREVPMSITVASVTGYVRVAFRVVESSTSTVLFSDVLQASWHQEKRGAQALALPSRPVLLETLAQGVTKDLVNRLTPHFVMTIYRLKYPEGEIWKAFELMRQGRWLESEEVFDQLTPKYPHDPNVHFGLGVVKEMIGWSQNDRDRLDQAERAYSKAVAVGGREPYFLNAVHRLKGLRRDIGKLKP